MQRVSVGFLEAGMVAARNVHSAEGRLLVTKETVLSEAMVANIQNLRWVRFMCETLCFRTLRRKRSSRRTIAARQSWH